MVVKEEEWEGGGEGGKREVVDGCEGRREGGRGGGGKEGGG